MKAISDWIVIFSHCGSTGHQCDHSVWKICCRKITFKINTFCENKMVLVWTSAQGLLRDACDLFPKWWQSRRTLTGSNPITARPVQQHQISFPTDVFQVVPWTQNSHLPQPQFSIQILGQRYWSEWIICAISPHTHRFQSNHIKTCAFSQWTPSKWLPGLKTVTSLSSTVFQGPLPQILL